MTSGQRWTAVIGLAFAAATITIGIPPVLRRHGYTAALGSEVAPARGAMPVTSVTGAAVTPVTGAAAGQPAGEAQFSGAPPPGVSVPAPVGRYSQLPTETPAGAAVNPQVVGNSVTEGPDGSVAEPSPAPSGGAQQPTLHAVAGGWAGPAGGSPAGPAGLSSGDLPVAWWGGPQKETFLRVAGNGAKLVMHVDATQSATYLDTSAVIWLCPITVKAWKVDPDSGPSSVPPFTCTLHAVGQRSSDGSEWTFDVGAFIAKALANGVTLQPKAPSGLPAYQVAFRGS